MLNILNNVSIWMFFINKYSIIVDDCQISGCNKLKIVKNGDKSLKFSHSISMMMFYQSKMGAHEEKKLAIFKFHV